MEVACVSVHKFQAERAIKELSTLNLVDKSFKIGRSGDIVCIPVVEVGEALAALEKAGLEARVESMSLEPLVKPKPLGEVFRGLSSYTLIGDILVFNWRSGIPDLEVYREAALKVMREQPRVKAAFLKYETWGEARVQKLEHLAGEKRTKTIHREYGLTFHVDIARVYFNPRLATEHRRIAEETSNGERVLDMFSGVGGFSIHIASLKKTRIVATDINPVAVKLLAENIRENKNLLGDIAVLRADAASLPLLLKPVFNRIIMDHPTASKYYVGEACRLAEKQALIHYYTRTITCEEARREFIEKAEKCCGNVEIEYCRKILEYSPSQAIYNITAKVKSGI